MARELDITINVQDGGAKQTLVDMDVSLEEVTRTATTSAERIAMMEAALARARAQASGTAAEMRKFAAESANSTKVVDRLQLEEMANRYAKARENLSKLSGEVKAATQPMQGFADSADRATTSMGGIDRMATRIITRMGILLALRGTFQFVEGLVVAAHQTETLADQLELSTTRVQEFQYAAEQTGVPLSTMTNALDTMQKKLGEGGSGITKALADLNLDLDQMRAKRPEEAYDAFALALGTVGDKFQRAGLEAEIFGNDKLDPVIRKFADLKQEAHDVGAILDTEHVKALSDVARGWDAATAAAKNYFANLAGDIALAAQGKGQSGSQSSTSAPLLGAGLLAGGVGGLAAVTLATGGTAGILALLLGAAGGAGAGIVGGLNLEKLREKYLPNQDEANYGPSLQAALAGVQSPALFGATGLTRARLGQNPLNPGNALQGAALDAAARSLTATAQASIEAGRQLQEFAKALETLAARAGKATDDLNKQASTRFGARTGAIGDEIIRQAQIGSELNPATAGLDPFQIATRNKDLALEDLRKRQSEAPGVDFSNEFLKIMRDFETATQAAIAAQAQNADAAHQSAVATTRAATSAGYLSSAFDAFRGSIPGGTGPNQPTIEDFERSNFTPGVIRSNVGGLLQLNTFFPGRAAGGPVSAGSPYIVGEQGPEMFVPGASGAIVPNGAGGSVRIGAIHIHGDVDSTSRVQQLADQIGRKIDQQVRTRGRRTLTSPR